MISSCTDHDLEIPCFWSTWRHSLARTSRSRTDGRVKQCSKCHRLLKRAVRKKCVIYKRNMCWRVQLDIPYRNIIIYARSQRLHMWKWYGGDSSSWGRRAVAPRQICCVLSRFAIFGVTNSQDASFHHEDWQFRVGEVVGGGAAEWKRVAQDNERWITRTFQRLIEWGSHDDNAWHPWPGTKITGLCMIDSVQTYVNPGTLVNFQFRVGVLRGGLDSWHRASATIYFLAEKLHLLWCFNKCIHFSRQWAWERWYQSSAW